MKKLVIACAPELVQARLALINDLTFQLHVHTRNTLSKSVLNKYDLGLMHDTVCCLQVLSGLLRSGPSPAIDKLLETELPEQLQKLRAATSR